MPISVIPYRSSKLRPVSRRQSSSTGTGHAADPLTVKRSLDAAAMDSARASGAMFPCKARMSMTYIVGTPMKTVTGGCAASRSRAQTPRGVNVRWNSTVAPTTCAHNHALTMPWM